jgi:hypothetical protein
MLHYAQFQGERLLEAVVAAASKDATSHSVSINEANQIQRHCMLRMA